MHATKPRLKQGAFVPLLTISKEGLPSIIKDIRIIVLKNLSIQMVCSALSTLMTMGMTVYTLDTQPGNIVSTGRKSSLLKEFLVETIL